MVFPVVMYGCESWTIKKAEHQKIDAFELWCWRRLLRVPWTARRSILREISPGCSLEGLMKLKFQYFGHLMWRADSSEKTLMLGKIVCAKSLLLCLTLCDPMDYSPPGSSVHEILQTRILEWTAKTSSGDLPKPGMEARSLMSPALAGGFFTTSITWEACYKGYLFYHYMLFYLFGADVQKCNWFWKTLIKLIIYLNTCSGFPNRQMRYVKIMTDFLQSFLYFFPCVTLLTRTFSYNIQQKWWVPLSCSAL